MKLKIVFLAATLMVATTLLGQAKGSLKGRVIDSATQQSMAYATISIIELKDSTLITFGRSDSSGAFWLDAVQPGRYAISISFVGYIPVWVDVTIKPKENIDMGLIRLSHFYETNEVTVTARRPPITINNDTLEFNAENFKTQPNAVVEDLLKRLPGFTIDPDGTVKVNGKKINKLYVNGREFFTGDPKMATKNLDADAVDKVQVFDKKSDKAEFTGFDDGNTQTAVNLKLKKDRDKSTFGRVTGGAGADDGRFDAQSNVNRFNGLQQLSFLGMGNNTNRIGFSFDDIMNFSANVAGVTTNGTSRTVQYSSDNDLGLPVAGFGIAQPGIANTYAGGINFNDYWNNKTDFNSSILLKDISLLKKIVTNRKSFLGRNSFDYQSEESETSKVQQKRWNAMIDHKFDSFTSIKINSQIAFQDNHLSLNKQYNTYATLGEKINAGNITKNNTSTGSAAVFNALFRKRFRRMGRTLSVNINIDNNKSALDGLLKTRNIFFAGNSILSDTLSDQHRNQNTVKKKLSSSVTFTEAIGRKSLLELSSYYSTNIGESEKNTYDFDSSLKNYSLYNTRLSNHFSSHFNYWGGILNIRTNLRKLSFSLGTSIQSTALVSRNETASKTITQQMTDLLPSFNVSYKLGTNRSVSLLMNTSTAQPSPEQLQPFVDISDPLNIQIGNPLLKRSYTQNLNFNYTHLNIYKQTSLFFYIFANRINNATTYSTLINTNGAKITTPVNTNGVSFVSGNLNYAFPIRKFKTRVDISLNGSESNNISFINNSKNISKTLSLSPTLRLTYYGNTSLNIFLVAQITTTKAAYSLQPEFNTHFLRQSYQAEIINSLPFGISMVNNFKYQINSGSSAGFNSTIPYWTFSLAQSFLKHKRGELKFSVQDLLNQNIGIRRSTGFNFIEDTQYNVLQRFFLLSFSYRIHKAFTPKSSGFTIRGIN